jgi:ammonia channel protein AmtB
MFWGFSLAYSRTASPFIGDLKNFGLINVTSAPSIGSPYIPDIVFYFYQLMFAACATMIVFCPIACWTWNPNGWLYTLPSLDFAGGRACSHRLWVVCAGLRIRLGQKEAPRRRVPQKGPQPSCHPFGDDIDLVWWVWLQCEHA